MKVAAGALGAGQPKSRWGEHHDTSAGSGLPAIVVGGLMGRSEEGLPLKMRVGLTTECGPLAKEEQAGERNVEKSRQ